MSLPKQVEATALETKDEGTCQDVLSHDELDRPLRECAQQIPVGDRGVAAGGVQQVPAGCGRGRGTPAQVPEGGGGWGK